MTEQVVLIAMGAVVAAVVLRPLLRSRSGTRGPSKAVVAAPPVSDEMAELELDRGMGRISEEDYQRWRADLERATPAPVADSESATTLPGAVASADDLVRRWKDAPRPTCANCGVRPEPEARFCSNCGTSLR